MTMLDAAADLRAWMDAHAPAADVWLETASALRRAALDVPGVARLADSASFRTHGRRGTVDGVALAPTVGGGARADVAVWVEAAVATEPGRLGAVGRAVEQAVRATWQRTGDARALEVAVHLVDVGPPAPSGAL